MKLEREFGSRVLLETRGPGHQCGGLGVQLAFSREDHCLFPFNLSSPHAPPMHSEHNPRTSGFSLPISPLISTY